jgi:mRNA-degrading endonuclease toxin of MazEF toxin-antitoxin module
VELPAPCVANLDDIATIPKTLIRRRIAVLSAEKMREIEAAIRFALDVP